MAKNKPSSAATTVAYHLAAALDDVDLKRFGPHSDLYEDLAGSSDAAGTAELTVQELFDHPYVKDALKVLLRSVLSQAKKAAAHAEKQDARMKSDPGYAIAGALRGKLGHG